MKYALLIGIVISSCTSWSMPVYLTDAPKNGITPIGALTLLIKGDKRSVYRCQEVTLSEKGTFKVAK